jgi:hypothetical protein
VYLKPFSVVIKGVGGLCSIWIGIKFGVYNNKNELVGEYTTDEQGNFEVKLPYGSYTVKQLTITTGHEKMNDFNIEVKEVGNTIKRTISNALDYLQN